MLRGKKGMMIKATIVGLAIMILSFILLFNFVYKFYMKSTEYINEEACHDSLILTQVLSEKTRISGVRTTEFVKPWPAVCKTQDKVYYEDDPDKIKKRISELMSWCWWMMGEGVIRPFDHDWFTTERKCFVCYTVQFPEMDGVITQNDFAYYLQDARAKTGQRYFDYLKYSEEKVIDSPIADEINKDGVYSIVYTHPADAAFTGNVVCLLSFVGAGVWAGGVGGIVTGAAGTIVCSAVAIAQWVDASKNDLVYVSHTNREKGGCIGSMLLAEEVQTGEGDVA